jgi:hypothetical protein
MRGLGNVEKYADQTTWQGVNRLFAALGMGPGPAGRHAIQVAWKMIELVIWNPAPKKREDH